MAPNKKIFPYEKLIFFSSYRVRVRATTYNHPITLTGAIVLTLTGLLVLGVFRIYIGWVIDYVRIWVCIGRGISRYMSYA